MNDHLHAHSKEHHEPDAKLVHVKHLVYGDRVQVDASPTVAPTVREVLRVDPPADTGLCVIHTDGLNTWTLHKDRLVQVLT